MATVAQLAGVSAATVSKVLNGQAGVGPATRQRVEALLREHGYRRPAVNEPAAAIEGSGGAGPPASSAALQQQGRMDALRIARAAGRL